MLLGQPLVLEWAFRFRATTPMELGASRHALPCAQVIIGIDLAIARGFPKFDSLKVALPEMYAMQPRDTLSWRWRGPEEIWRTSLTASEP